MFRILYRFLAALAGLAFRSGRSQDLEIIVLRTNSACCADGSTEPTSTTMTAA